MAANRGRGFSREALEALLADAIDDLGATGLEAVLCVPDLAANRLLLRLGFVARYACEGAHHRMRRYLPGMRRSDCGVVTTLAAREWRSAWTVARAA